MKSKLTFLLLAITCIFITLSINLQHANASSGKETIIYETTEETSTESKEDVPQNNETIPIPLSDFGHSTKK